MEHKGFARFVCSVLFIATLLARCEGATGADVTLSGYLSDVLCYDKCLVSPDCDNCALDGADVIRRPNSHTVHCIRDLEVCYSSGYYVAMNTGGSAAPTYRPKYVLDGAGHAKALALVRATSVSVGLKVTIHGYDKGNHELAVYNITECTGGPSVCDGSCVGCVSSGVIDGEVSGVKHDLVVAHASLLITAWCFLAPLAWLIKRHQHTPGCPNPKACGGYPVAFILHGAIMLTVFLFTLIAVSIALHNFQADGKRVKTGAHFFVGLLIFVLTLWQPLPALFCRPGGDSPRRPLFNYVHRGVGYLLLVIAVVNCFTGTLNYDRLYGNNCTKEKRFRGPLLAGVGIFYGLAVILEVYRQVRICREPAGATEHDGHKELSEVQS